MNEMILVVCFAILGLSSPALGDAPEVTISQGKMVGETLLSRDGREYSSFQSIPFAEPPVDGLRFMAPLPAKSWDGVLNASVPSPPCYQKPFLMSQTGMQGQEDCLYLNVFSPNLKGSYPVMIYIHGGAYEYGWPGRPLKEQYFMDEDVVLVTVAYRLGHLGFMSFEDDVIPGNYGIKDQVLAVEWVKKEIKNFGGNPDLLTVFGISAGAASSHYLCSIQKTQGLLKGCISHSGVAGAIWSLHTPGDAKKMAVDIAKKVGCDKYSGSELLTCLQAQPIDSFIPTSDVQHITDLPIPVLEKPSNSAVITQWPTGYSDFPWIAGIMANEGLLITEYIKAFATPLEKMGFYVGGNLLVSKALHLKGNVIEKLFKITERFFEWKDLFDLLADFERFFTEGFFEYPILKEMMRHNGPKYLYRFQYTGGPSLWEEISNKKLNIDGVCHGDDAPYFFDLTNYYTPEGWPTQKDVELSKKLVKAWVHFAKYQVPKTEELEWEPLGDYASYLHITNDGIQMENFTNYKDILDFWNGILA
ncbi:carboxylic ester hydrolase [Halyomorpha halys]|uniref:carboxylic ester hydrolase n=1 Tax=Halyomorpha halys TaxID=286706 RepID=UPI0006D51A5D|nr:venom carboxylesterase-6-like [Halyomorpha halys]KAE8573489.1 hypothetical protein A483_HHAL011944 [Halyomorpha halys]